MHISSIFWLAVIYITATGAVAGAVTISDPGQGLFAISNGPGGGLSDLAYKSANDFFAVSDSDGKMYPLTIEVSLSSGLIQNAALGTPVTMTGGADMEGVAYDPNSNELIISDESGPTLRRYPVTGGVGTNVTIPAIYSGPGFVANFSLESVSRQSNTGHIWIANEEALSVDGPLASPPPPPDSGSIIRIANLTTTKQYAYRTDAERTPLINASGFSGVTAIVVLPNNQILVLEREASASNPPFRSRIYLADISGATDVSTLAGLIGETFTPASKTLLWEKTFANTNFEGMTLGPTLANGDRTLLLVSDDDSNNTLSTYVLHLQRSVPEPATLGLFAGGLFLLVSRRRRRA